MNRIFELDVLRGLTVALMIVVDSTLSGAYATLLHSAWAGMTLADTLFPAFVFAMGAAAEISTSRRQPSLTKILRRAGLLFGAGFSLNLLIYIVAGGEYVRIFGVLQRLALTYVLGMLILQKIKSTAKISAVAFLLLLVSSVGFHVYAPENPFSELDNISRAVDFTIPGQNYLYEKTHDPEGLYGLLASTASMIFGVVAGRFLVAGKRRQMILYGVGLLIVGYGWSYFDVVAKKIWTTPFALMNAGGDMVLLAALGILFVAMPSAKKLFSPFEALGKNPIIFFIGSNVAIILLYVVSVEGVPVWFWLYQKTFRGIFDLKLGITLFSVAWCVVWMIPAEILNRRKIFIRF